MNIIEGAGIFIYPLGLCSVIAVMLIIDRLIALRGSRTLQLGPGSISMRIKDFYGKEPNTEKVYAFAKWEISKLERGLYLLDIITAAAPLIGLLGTVVGLIQVFSNISYQTGMPDPDTFVKGVALALTTTMLGLVIAIPSLAGHAFICRRIEKLSAALDYFVQDLISPRGGNDE